MTETQLPPTLEPVPAEPARRRRRLLKLAATLATMAGLFVTALGAGVSFRYLSKTGLTWTAAFGLLLLAAGLALLAFAGIFAWRYSRRRQRLWFIPVVVVGLMLMWSFALGTMFAFAPRTPLGSLTPASRGVSYTEVTFRTSDGVRLSAWYIPSVNHAAIVTLPGAGSARTATLDQAVVLARHGYGVLMVDPRGQGRSGGRAMDAGWYGDRDVTASVAFLQHRSGVDPPRSACSGCRWAARRRSAPQRPGRPSEPSSPKVPLIAPPGTRPDIFPAGSRVSSSVALTD